MAGVMTKATDIASRLSEQGYRLTPQRIMILEAIECEMAFTDDVIHEGVTGLPKAHIRQYLEFVADQRLVRLGIKPHFGTKNPLDFMMLQDVAEHTNFFERTVSAYQVAVEGDVSFGESF